MEENEELGIHTLGQGIPKKDTFENRLNQYNLKIQDYAEANRKSFGRGAWSPHSPLLDNPWKVASIVTNAQKDFWLPQTPEEIALELVGWKKANMVLNPIKREVLQAIKKNEAIEEIFNQKIGTVAAAKRGNPLYPSSGEGGKFYPVPDESSKLPTPGGDRFKTLFNNQFDVDKIEVPELTKWSRPVNEGGFEYSVASARDLLRHLEDFRIQGNTGRGIDKFNPKNPVEGFTETTGVENLFKGPDGENWKYIWSRGRWRIVEEFHNLDRRFWNKNSTALKAKQSDAMFALARQKNATTKAANINLWDLAAQEKGSIYIEHITSPRSGMYVKGKDGIWRHKITGLAPRDAENIFITGDANFKSLKDRLETGLYAPNSNWRKQFGEGIYIDYNTNTHELILKNSDGTVYIADNGRSIPIPAYIPAKDWRRALEYALTGDKKGYLIDNQAYWMGMRETPTRYEAQMKEVKAEQGLKLLNKRIKGKPWSFEDFLDSILK